MKYWPISYEKYEENIVRVETAQARAVSGLREIIFKGELDRDRPLSEEPLAKRLGVSRTPIRHAFTVLEQEGLLYKTTSGRYHVKQFHLDEIRDAVKVRAQLEGLAAQTLVEQGMNRKIERQLSRCLEEGDKLLEDGTLSNGVLENFSVVNARFHGLIVEGSQNAALIRAYEMIIQIPFVSPHTVIVDKDVLDDDLHTVLATPFQRVSFAHTQHHLIVQALIAREAARAEALMKEHANIAQINMKLIEQNKDPETSLEFPGIRLIET